MFSFCSLGVKRVRRIEILFSTTFTGLDRERCSTIVRPPAREGKLHASGTKTISGA
jgi:hypothetical protein